MFIVHFLEFAALHELNDSLPAVLLPRGECRSNPQKLPACPVRLLSQLHLQIEFLHSARPRVSG